mmetsp:Transcript_11675/g.41701  ORF Transcript_11675/g.41701 Transcript_11675/m.41701 type:complete len:347 (+) Transcript_11675:41-1081(+)
MGRSGDIFKKLAAGATPEELSFSAPLDNGLTPISEVLRTPDEHFRDLPDFPFQPHYFQSRSHGDIRIHYLDEGPKTARETILLMHGEPSWCFLYRHMIPPLVAAGLRVVAPDLVGFGRSDKPARRADYSYERHVSWMSELVVAIGLDNCTLFAQDWGGLIGLRVVSRYPERFLRIAIGNTALPTGNQGFAEAFKIWAGVVSQKFPHWGLLVDASVVRTLSPAEQDAYEAPFPSEAFKAASREFPRLVPQYPDHASVEENMGAWRRVFERWQKPFLTLFSDSDPVTKNGEKIWQRRVPGAKGQAHHIVEKAGHFLQEDKPLELAERILEFIRRNPCALNPPPATAKL